MNDKNQIQRRPAEALAGTYRSPRDVNAAMQQAAAQCHLIAPATSVGSLPEGCGVALSVVTVDIARDTYDVGMGKRGLSKTVLQKIGAALGVSWDPTASGRIDDGSDPNYVHWRAVGHYRNFDGQIQTIAASKEMDLRRGSPQVEALEDRARSKNKSADLQIREMRLHIMAHAESKAQLRALRSIGIKTAYDSEELKKPFLAAKVAFTGETNSPELRRLFAEKIADSFLDGRRNLYGAPGAAPTSSAPRLAAPPPVGSIAADVDDYPDSGEWHTDEPAAQAPAETRREEPRQEAREDRSEEPRTERQASGYVIPGGKNKGAPIEQADDRDLQYWAGAFEKDLETGNARNPVKDRERLNAFRAELASRNGGQF